VDPVRAQFEALQVETFQRWVEEKRTEDLRLDFKMLEGGDHLERGDRKQLAIAVSGFANADGGLIVWGVDCRKDKDGVDAAQALRPIQQLKRVHSQLVEHTAAAASPTVDGVEHRMLFDGEDSGYLATLVPVSARGPHMALHGEQRYYKRSGSSFLKMEHFEVADMFGKRQRPELKVDLTYKQMPDSTSDIHYYQLQAKVENVGRAIARFFKVTLSMPREVNGWPADAAGNHLREAALEEEYLCTLAPLFPGESRTLNFDQHPYHVNTALHWKFEEQGLGWPSATVRVYQEAAPPTELKRSIYDLSDF
jgi:hypothetical protein